MKDLLIQQDMEIVGRGTVLILSLSENQVSVRDFVQGGIIFYEGHHYIIRGVEAMKKLFGDYAFLDKIGVLVKVIGEDDIRQDSDFHL